MRRILTPFTLLVASLVLAGPVQATPSRHHCRHPRHHPHRCIHKRHRHPRPVPTHYGSSVDPSFTQDPHNPLLATYSYSADATAIINGIPTDLAQTDQLPAGILNFYSAQTPGGPQTLYCSTNVGGAVSQADCPILYAAPGTFQVTTQYIPDGVSAVTETDSETINPYRTSTKLSSSPVTCDSSDVPPQYAGGTPQGFTEACYQIEVTVLDQNGNPPPFNATILTVTGAQMGGNVLHPNTPCTLGVWDVPNSDGGGGASGGYSPDCYNGRDSVRWEAPIAGDGWTLTATYQPTIAWAGSSATATFSTAAGL